MHSKTFFDEVAKIAQAIDVASIEKLAKELAALCQRGGRLFFLGVGRSAANCSHAVNDFRKLCGIEVYTPLDNVPELTARTNDEGWDTVFAAWLKTSKANKNDAVFVFSVLGLAYKQDTHSTKNSASLALLAYLQPFRVRVFDPVVPASAIPNLR
jgi:D-sedoheptulose 7-phosphate isomerase